MVKKLKGIGLVLFSICCTVGFSSSVNAETLEMDKDMKASEIAISDGLVIDGKGEYTITGGLSISNNASVTIKNVTLDGEGTKDILLSLSNAGDIVIENVKSEEELKGTVLTNTPVLFLVDETSMKQFRQNLVKVLSRKDISQNQLFFLKFYYTQKLKPANTIDIYINII